MHTQDLVFIACGAVFALALIVCESRRRLRALASMEATPAANAPAALCVRCHLRPFPAGISCGAADCPTRQGSQSCRPDRVGGGFLKNTESEK